MIAMHAPPAITALRERSGCDAWKRLGIVRITGIHRGDRLDGSFEEIVDTKDGRYRLEWDAGDFASSSGFDGRTSWGRDFSSTTHVTDAPSAVAMAKTEAWLRARGWCDRNSASYAAFGTGHAVNGDVLDVVEARPIDGAPALLYVDRETHLLDLTSVRYNENHYLTYYGDWREFEGTVVPFVRRIVDPEDVDIETRTVRYVTPNIEEGRDAFSASVTAWNVTMPAHATEVTVPYVMDGYKPIVDVTIDGKGPFPFVVDAGGHFILTAQTARSVGLSGRGAATSVNGRSITHAGYARVHTLGIGGAVLRDEVALIDPYPFAKLERGPRPPKAGWLGLEFFERFAVTFDPRARKMTLRPLDAPRPVPSGTKAPIFFDEDSPLTTCSIAGKSGICMLDTGNAGPVLIANQWADRSGVASQLINRGVNVGGRYDAYVTRVPVEVGAFTRPGELVYYNTDTSELLNTVEAGILSEAWIDSFVTSFDYARRGVWLTPLPQEHPTPFNRSGVFAGKNSDGTFVVTLVLRGSPAERAGIHEGDVIVAVDGISTLHFSRSDFDAINASRRHTIALTVQRKGVRKIVTVPMRDLLPYVE